jgi:hypothetical protein
MWSLYFLAGICLLFLSLAFYIAKRPTSRYRHKLLSGVSITALPVIASEMFLL